jgi:type IV fimbrial biogenesis protein FimT
MRPSIKTRGVTLVEVIIGIAIVAMVLGFGLPSYKEWIQNSRIRNAAESIVNGLQIARSEAVKRNRLVQFQFTDGSGWTVGCVAPDANCPAEIQRRYSSDGSSDAVTIVAADGPIIVFDNFGRMTAPVPAINTYTVIDVDIDPSMLSAALSRQLRIEVDIGGKTRMCDPNVAAADDTRRCLGI